jgi:hypothetical protein
MEDFMLTIVRWMACKQRTERASIGKAFTSANWTFI